MNLFCADDRVKLYQADVLHWARWYKDEIVWENRTPGGVKRGDCGIERFYF